MKQASGKFKGIAKERWEVVLEDINDKFEVVKEVNQKVDDLTGKVDGLTVGLKETNQKVDNLTTEFREFKHQTESNFKTLHHLLSQVDLLELQERAVRIERHLELKS